MEKSEGPSHGALAPRDRLIREAFEALDPDPGIRVPILGQGDPEDSLVILVRNDQSTLGIEGHRHPRTLRGGDGIEELCVEALEQGVWTVAFLAIDPKRAEKIAFTESYLAIEGSYLVRTESRFFTNKDVDQPGVRIAVGKNAAYDLYLSRNLESAELVRAATTPGALELFVEEGLEVAAGVKLPLLQFADKNPSFRVLDEPFMAINQAMCAPQGHPAGFDYLKTFIAEIKNNGTLEQIFRKFDQGDLL